MRALAGEAECRVGVWSALVGPGFCEAGRRTDAWTLGSVLRSAAAVPVSGSTSLP